MAVPQHTHPEIENRISGEMSAMTTELLTLRAELRRGFSDVAQVLGQILARLPEAGGDA